METSFYKKPNTCHLAVHLLLSAAWRDHEVFFGGKKVILKRGQIPCGRNGLAEETGLSPQEIRTSLQRLRESGFLTIESTNQGSIITICKYEEYQPQQSEHQPANQPTSNQRATNEQPLQNKGNKGIYNNTPLPPMGANGSVLKNYPYPEWLNKQLWSDFCKMRLRIKKPVTTERTVKNLLSALERLMQTHGQDEIIQASIDHCWQDFYPLKDKQQPSAKPTITPKPYEPTYAD